MFDKHGCLAAYYVATRSLAYFVPAALLNSAGVRVVLGVWISVTEDVLNALFSSDQRPRGLARSGHCRRIQNLDVPRYGRTRSVR
jgi:hypothetical protein